MAGFTCAEIQQKVTDLKALISEYETASLQIATDQIQSYTFDSGQTKQTVTKFNLTELNNVIDSLYNRLSMLCARFPECTGGTGGAIIARPAW